MSDPSRPLDGRVALVTGAARGIGQRIAVRLATAGADVAVTSRDPAALSGTVEEIEAAGSRAATSQLDLLDPDGAASAVTRAVEQLGGLDVVVANSGVGGPTAPLWEVDVDDWDQTFDVNVRGTWLTLRAATRHMIDAGTAGSVVVIGSLTGKRPLVDRSPYVVSKSALIGLVRSYATEVGPMGIRANLVSPGFVSGERLDWVIAGQAASRGLPEDEVRDELAALAPLRRFVSPEDVAETVLFLASDTAAGITGTDVNVTAGVVMY